MNHELRHTNRLKTRQDEANRCRCIVEEPIKLGRIQRDRIVSPEGVKALGYCYGRFDRFNQAADVDKAGES